jgi:autotransporter-associated beta strand protein
MFNSFRILLSVFVSLIPILGMVQSARAFQHPGIPLTVADLDNVKTNLNTSPWSDGYSALTSDSRSQLSYTMQGPFGYVNRNLSGNYDHESQWKNDMQAIFNLSRMWYFTGNTNYAQKSHDILIAWANTMTNFNGVESALDLGDYAYRYSGGADILRGTWPGWTTADTLTVSNFFARVYLPATGMNTTMNVAGPSNKGALQLAGGLACAVFNDDTNLFNQILYLYRTAASCGLHNNCLTSGEMGETGRDQGHAYGDLLQMSFLAEIFWKQGVDVYSEDDNRLLACGEYYGRNNLSPAATYITYGTTDEIYWNNSTNSGGSSAGGIYASEPMEGNILRSAYVVRKGLTAPWMVLKRATQGENMDSFCYLKTADTSTAAPPAAIIYPAVATVTTGLINTDIGSVGVSGSGSYSGGTWTVVGGGVQVWTHSADSCHFVYKQITGNCTIIAKVNSVQNTAATAKAGVMIRDSLSSSAANRAWVAITASSTFESYNHGWTQCYGGSNWETHPRNGQGAEYLPSTPYWVKLERVGNTISTYISLDGTSWEASTVAVFGNMPNTTYVGLFVCALTSTANTSTFSNVSITGGNGGNVTVPPAPYAIYASPDAGRVPLRWLQSFGATNYNVLRSTTNGGPYTTIATVTNASYVDTSVSPNTTYYYVITASNSAGTSTNSPPDSATTQPVPAAPTGLNAFPGNARATLLWLASSSATSYNVKRSTTSGSGYVTVTNVTGNSFVNTGLANGTTYYYVVSSVNVSGEGANSTQVSVTPSASAAALIWSGVVNGTWDTATVNWLNGGASATFQNGNAVVFDDSASANTTISLSANRSPGAVVFNNSSKSYAFSGSAIAGTGSLIKQGSGSLMLTSANTYTGGTTNSGGTLSLGDSGALGTGTLTLNGGTLQNIAAITVNNNIVSGGGGTISIPASGGQDFWVGGSLSGTGPLTLGGGGPTKSLNLGFAANTVTGDITIPVESANQTVVRFKTTTAGSATAAWTIGGAPDRYVTVDFTTGTIEFGALSGSGILSGNATGTKTLSVGALGTSTTFSGIMQNGSGTLALTKIGGGTLTLTGANTYTGGSAVNLGSLVISTVSAANGNYTVANGATLGVNNVSSGSAAANNLTVAAGSTLEFQNVASTNTPLIAAGSVTVNGSCTVKITGTNGLVAGNIYPLVSYTGTLSGSFANLQLQTSAGISGVLVSNSQQIALSVVSIPLAPTNLMTTAGDAQASLKWNASAGATGYNVKQSTDRGATYNLIATVTATNYINTGLVNGEVYYYVVSAVYSGGETADSVAASVAPVSTTVPELGMTFNGSQLQLFWPQDHTGWTLQMQTNSLNTGLGTNWVGVTNSTVTNQLIVPFSATNGSVFFRLVYP